MGTLFIIGTPIGNLGDLSFRAVETLKAVSMAAAEDTRRTLKLLTHFGIRVTVISCRSGNEKIAAQKVASILDSGESVAYMSDAGTPGMSDPGSTLVRTVVAAGHTVIPIPGPSAFTSLVSVSGATDKTIVFEGFLSPKSGRRRTRVKELLDIGNAFVLYESPFRVVKLLQDLAEFDSKRYICVGREMTKLHEEYLRGSVAEVLMILSARFDQKGEFSIFVSGKMCR
ncbi:MAG: 16S rRNA (cytidine(1402)-2'-O)-methyltransferase [Treponema sp.]|jgi:16S rRNA (cytidine1402-2'-O)-methyltransferase|nr:16S rRNA (cytidine(1402)-2'-O)-methyltransferase [Treponema sp.]